MKINRLMAVLAACALGVCVAPATAQSTSNSQLLGGGVMYKFSASDVASMLSDFEIETALADYDGGELATMVARTSGGAQFLISLLACDNLATATGCQRAIVFTATSNAGFAYEDLNDFNLGSDVTKAMNLASENIVIFGIPIYSGGGIGRDNFKLLTALFLNDMQNFSEAQSTAASQVSFDNGPKPAAKLDNIGSASQSAPREIPLYSAAMTEHAVSAAVANTWRVEFLTGNAKAALE